MKRKTKRIIARILIALFVVFLSIGLVVAFLPQDTNEVEETVTTSTFVKPLEIPEPSTKGKLTVKMKDTDKVVFEYEGDNINVINTGITGEDILVEVILPSNNLCECLEEGGNSYE